MKYDKKELCKIQYTKIFEDYYEFKQKNVILNTIRVALLGDDNQLKKLIPFDIQVVGEEGFRVRPCVFKGKFIIMYECYMDAYKVEIPADAFLYKLRDDGNFEIYIPCIENK